MNQDITLPWLQAGHALFSAQGPAGLRVEMLARAVGKSKSSFYHHFADLEVFTDLLLAYHLQQAERIAQREAQCKNVVPELVDVLLDVKQDLLFSRQLRIHRTVPTFRRCFEAENALAVAAIGKIWAEMLGLTGDSALARMVLALSLENFFLQITEATLNRQWLVGYLDELRTLVQRLQARPLQAVVR